MIYNMCTYFKSTINLQVNRNLLKYTKRGKEKESEKIFMQGRDLGTSMAVIILSEYESLLTIPINVYFCPIFRVTVNSSIKDIFTLYTFI